MKTGARSISWVMMGLIALVAGLVGWMLEQGHTTRLEAFASVTGALCVWLTVKENVWNFPLGLVNVVAFSVVFFESRLFADAGLQIVYFFLGCIGWYLWLYGGKDHSELKVGTTGRLEMTLVTLFVVISTIGLWKLLSRFGGSASFWDALTTSISLGAQWLLNRKRLENWIAWIVVDAIYVPLYIYKGLHLTAILYAVFLVMATIGLLEWARRMRAAEAVRA